MAAFAHVLANFLDAAQKIPELFGLLLELVVQFAAAGGGLLRLPQRMPYHIAMECILTGDMLSAERAHQNGLINRLTEPGTALDAAIELANAVAANGPLSLIASKRVATESVDWTREEMFDRQAEITNPVFASQDAREGASAFAEKRKPVWKGV